MRTGATMTWSDPRSSCGTAGVNAGKCVVGEGAGAPVPPVTFPLLHAAIETAPSAVTARSTCRGLIIVLLVSAPGASAGPARPCTDHTHRGDADSVPAAASTSNPREHLVPPCDVGASGSGHCFERGPTDAPSASVRGAFAHDESAPGARSWSRPHVRRQAP